MKPKKEKEFTPEFVKQLQERIILREQVIENQRKLIEALRNDLRQRNQWWKFWKTI